MSKKGMEFTFVKLVLVIFIVLLMMMAVYRFYWKSAKETLDPTISDLADQWQKEREKMQETTGTAVADDSEGGG